MAVTIYALCDVRVADPVQRVRYIGQTIRPLHVRLARHAGDAKRGEDTHRARWMRSVWSDGADVAIETLLSVKPAEWGTAEQATISHYRALGCQLTNSTAGGDGMLNPTAETRRKLSLAKMGNTNNKGNRHRLGAKHTLESRAKMSVSHMGQRTRLGIKHTEASKAKMSTAKVGRKHDPRVYDSRRLAFSGDGNPSAKLSWPAVRQIRQDYKDGLTKTQISRNYAVSISAVTFVLEGRTWVEREA